jgi:hypothetical protein
MLLLSPISPSWRRCGCHALGRESVPIGVGVPPELDLPAQSGGANSKRSRSQSRVSFALALRSRRCPRSTATASGA